MVISDCVCPSKKTNGASIPGKEAFCSQSSRVSHVSPYQPVHARTSAASTHGALGIGLHLHPWLVRASMAIPHRRMITRTAKVQSDDAFRLISISLVA